MKGRLELQAGTVGVGAQVIHISDRGQGNANEREPVDVAEAKTVAQGGRQRFLPAIEASGGSEDSSKNG